MILTSKAACFVYITLFKVLAIKDRRDFIVQEYSRGIFIAEGIIDLTLLTFKIKQILGFP